MSPLGSCNKVIFPLHFAWPEGLPLSPVCSPHISLPLSGAVLGCRFCLSAARECCMIALGSAQFLWTALLRENNMSQASLNAHTFGDYRPVIHKEGSKWGYQNEQFYGSKLFTSNEHAIIAQIRQRSACWEGKNLQVLLSALHATLERSPCQIHCTCHKFPADRDANNLWRARRVKFVKLLWRFSACTWSMPQRAPCRVSAAHVFKCYPEYEAHGWFWLRMNK